MLSQAASLHTLLQVVIPLVMEGLVAEGVLVEAFEPGR